MKFPNELENLLRELRDLLKCLLRQHRRLYVGVIVQQECKNMNPASLITGKPAQATATVTDANGNPASGVTHNWSVDDTTVATVDPSSGAITLTGLEGSFNIVDNATDATGAKGSGSCACTVTLAAPGVLTVTVDVTQ